MRIGLLADVKRDTAPTIEDSINGFMRHSSHEVVGIRFSGGLDHSLGGLDALIVHYSLIAYPYEGDKFLDSKTRAAVANFDGPKMAWVQDDYRNIYDRARLFSALGIHHVFTLADVELREQIYSPDLVSFSTSQLLAGYIAQSQFSFTRIPWEERQIDIGYRARKLPDWYGALGSDKYRISNLVRYSPAMGGLRLDVSTEETERLYGSKWESFLANTRVALGTESGCSVLDFDGSLSFSTQPGPPRPSLRPTVSSRPANYAVISPRIFEYALAGNLMALFPGYYSGILRPWDHYFPIKKDGTNLNELVDLMKSDSERRRMIERVDKEVLDIDLYGYKALATEIDKEIRNLSLRVGAHAKPTIGEYGLSRSLGKLRKPISRRLLDTYDIIVQVIPTNRLVGIRRRLSWLNILILSAIAKLGRLEYFVAHAPNILLRRKVNVLSLTKSLAAAFELLDELAFLDSEFELASSSLVRIKLTHYKNSIWLEWETPKGNFVHPFLRQFPRNASTSDLGVKGVFFSRADFAQTSSPKRLDALSDLSVSKEAQTLRMLEKFTVL